MEQQLEGLATEEIQALIAEAHAILTRRQAEEERVQHEESENEPEVVRGEGGSWLEHELVSCGKCSRCVAGERPHGPYWYLYSYTGSRMKSRYVGRRLPEELARQIGKESLAGFKPEEAFPESWLTASSKEM